MTNTAKQSPTVFRRGVVWPGLEISEAVVLSQFLVPGVVWPGHWPPVPYPLPHGVLYTRKGKICHSTRAPLSPSPTIAASRPDPPFLRGEKPCAFHLTTIQFAPCRPLSTIGFRFSVLPATQSHKPLTPTRTRMPPPPARTSTDRLRSTKDGRCPVARRR